MSPEQASGRSHEANSQSDQYSLGIVLYEVLAGQPPFVGPASIVMFHVVKSEPGSLADHDPSIPRDLVLICNKAITKDPAQRYTSCGELAEDLRRWLDGEVPRVRVLSRRERFVRFAKKDPKLASAVLVAACSILLVAVLGTAFGVISGLQARWLKDSRDEEARAREIAVDVSLKEAEARILADGNARQSVRELAVAHFDRGTALCEKGEVSQGLCWFVESIRLAEQADDADLAGVARTNLSAWRYHLNSLTAVKPLAFQASAVAVSPDGRLLAIVGEDGPVPCLQFFKLPECDPVGTVHYLPSPIHAVAFDPTGHTAITGNERGEIEAWSSHDGTSRGILHRPKSSSEGRKILGLAVSPDGKRILYGGSDGTAGTPSQGSFWDFLALVARLGSAVVDMFQKK